ncbi:Protein of unknown function [Bacteroides ovatus]|uniref:DUF551 domain-containing protein n=1 Tax=Bacteroides ovatus TaxID=28116 RepID=A0A1G6G579_BACOV|nr:DUF551 domain-containing protein [Bacteroides ovatus]SDB77167.1 Protein of unknown function [Bacteroides ovatus]
MNFKSLVAQLANRINQPHVIEIYMRKVFASGVEWQKKQSPWISVEERLPNYKEEVLVLYEYEGRIQIQQSFYLGEKDWKFGSNKILAWMPIPSFDEILEANRDVLERIKEKGD